MIAKMKSLNAFGTNRPPAIRLSPRPDAEDPARARAPAAPGRCGSRRPADPTTGRARSGCGPSGSRAARRGSRPARPPPPSTARWNEFAPATKNIVNAVRVMTIVVPRSGSLNTSAMTGAMISRNGTVPAQNLRTRGAALGEPVREIDDQRELGDLGRVDGRQRAELQPARRAADDDVELGTNTRTSRPSATT